jgi:hypothetical protein
LEFGGNVTLDEICNTLGDKNAAPKSNYDELQRRVTKLLESVTAEELMNSVKYL